MTFSTRRPVVCDCILTYRAPDFTLVLLVFKLLAPPHRFHKRPLVPPSYPTSFASENQISSCGKLFRSCPVRMVGSTCPLYSLFLHPFFPLRGFFCVLLFVGIFFWPLNFFLKALRSDLDGLWLRFPFLFPRTICDWLWNHRIRLVAWCDYVRNPDTSSPRTRLFSFPLRRNCPTAL